MSSFVSTMAYESELNNIVKEYLECMGYDMTSSALDRECVERSKPVPTVPAALRTNSASVTAQKSMLKHFHKGDREQFFQLWEQHLSQKLRQGDSVAQKLEFYLHIYFATYSVRHHGVNDEDAVAEFRHFLETKGAQLSQTTEFLPFYALPYVPDPRNHPSFREVFSDKWVPELQVRLERFLAMALDSERSQCRLFELYKGSGSGSSGGGKSNGSGNSAELQSQLVEAEKRTMQYMRRHNKVQADYHNLIGITAELVDTLEASLQGRPVSPQFLQHICSKLFAAQTASLDLTRPGSAGQALRQSVREPSARLGSAGKRPDAAGVSSSSSSSSSTDYAALRQRLLKADADLAAALLQALRWRLTRAETEARHRCVAQWVSSDLFGMSAANGDPLLQCLSSKDARLRESASRLLNAFASICRGRSYLTSSRSSEGLLQQLVELCQTASDQPIRDQLVGSLQKLSLRRKMQSGMIRMQLIAWLTEQLADHDSLTDYGLEYSVALLMNLCLRTAGKKSCAPPLARRILKVLSDLLGHENRDILPYVNGALYSILAVPAVRAEARAMDMEAILNCFIKPESPDMNRQLEFIIRQLNSDEAADLPDSDDEAEPDDDDDEEADVIEPDVDRNDSVTHSPSGEVLLQEFAASGSGGGGGGGEPLTRPVTPGNRPPTRPGTANGKQQQQQLQAMQMEELEPERPRTGAGGSRPNSGTASSRPRTGDARAKSSDGRPRTSDSRSSRRQQQQQQQQQQQPQQKKDEPFASRPKLPRTPEPTKSHTLPKSRPGSSGQQQPQQSQRK